MSDKENTPEDDFENDDFVEEELETVEKIASVSENPTDGDVDDVDLSNIDNDFDDDDEFYGGEETAKGKWLNIVGIMCFILAGLVGVWQFWLSGVDKYEDKNIAAATVAPAPVVPIESVAPVVNELPVTPVTDDVNVAVAEMEETPAVEGLPEVSVEMSEEEILDSELSPIVEAVESDLNVVSETTKESADESTKEVSDLANSLVEESTEMMADSANVSEIIPEIVEPVEEIAEEITSVEKVPVEEEAVVSEDVVVEASAIEETAAVEETVADVDVAQEVTEPAPETVTEPVKEDIVADTSEIVKKLDEVETAPALPKQEELKPIVEEELVEEVETIVPDQIEYGSLTPEQILERAVVVRPTPKRIVVVKKDRSSTSSRSILVAADRSLKQGSFADALSLYDDVLSKSPKNTSALMGKALTLQKLNHNEKASQAYQQVLDIDPNNLNAMTNLLSLTTGGNVVASINSLKTMEANNPKSAAIAGQLGMLYGEMKDVSNAARYFKKAQALDPNNAVYPYNLAILSDRMGSTSKALEHYQKTMQLVVRHGGQGVVSDQVVARRINELTSAN